MVERRIKEARFPTVKSLDSFKFAAATCLKDPRAPERVVHRLAEIIRFRLLMIAAGYEDGNDADSLRADPMFKLALDRWSAAINGLTLAPSPRGSQVRTRLSAGGEWIRTFSSAPDAQRFRSFVRDRPDRLSAQGSHPSSCWLRRIPRLKGVGRIPAYPHFRQGRW
jgi:hypothetical protein